MAASRSAASSPATPAAIVACESGDVGVDRRHVGLDGRVFRAAVEDGQVPDDVFGAGCRLRGWFGHVAHSLCWSVYLTIVADKRARRKRPLRLSYRNQSSPGSRSSPLHPRHRPTPFELPALSIVVHVSGLLVLNGGRSIFTAFLLPLGVYMVTGAQMGISRRLSRIEKSDPKYYPVPGCGLTIHRTGSGQGKSSSAISCRWRSDIC